MYPSIKFRDVIAYKKLIDRKTRNNREFERKVGRKLIMLGMKFWYIDNANVDDDFFILLTALFLALRKIE